MSGQSREKIGSRVSALAPWFHDIDLAGHRTAPDHPLGDFLHELWSVVERKIPLDMRGMTALDIGCNAGFYSLQLHRRGARVTGIDHDPRYLEQARFAAEVVGADIEYLQLDVYDLDRIGRRFDYVLFMGVMYHLRHPLYALEKVAATVGERLVFQTMLRGCDTAFEPEPDYSITERDVFAQPDFPALHFIEGSYAGDPTNWWIPNRSAVEGMLRSCGLRIDERSGAEVYLCSPTSTAAEGPRE